MGWEPQIWAHVTTTQLADAFYVQSLSLQNFPILAIP